MTRRLARLLPIFTLLCFFAFYALFLAPSPAYAAFPNFNSWQVKNILDWEKTIINCDENPANPILNSECFSGPYSLGNTIYTLIDAINPPQTARIRSGHSKNPGSPGAMGLMTQLIATTLVSQPSSIDYLADVSQNLGINLIPKTYAQGVGSETALKPLLPLWKIFRNIAYSIFTVIFVVIGFMIMFRRKIDPQTVVSIQNSIPRIAVTLILITFSYAIVGLLVDVMVLGVNAIAFIFKSNQITGLETSGIQDLTNRYNVFSLVDPIKNAAEAISKPLQDALEQQSLIDPEATKGLGAFAGLASGTVWLVLSITALFAMFKIFFMLLESYVHIILGLIFGPLQLLSAAVPGNKTIHNWFTQLLSHILVFPVTFALLFVAATLLAQYDQLNSAQFNRIWNIRTPDESLNWAPPMIGTSFGQVLGPLAAFGILLTIPQIGNLIKAAFEVKEVPTGVKEELRGSVGWVPFVGSYLGRAF